MLQDVSMSSDIVTQQVANMEKFRNTPTVSVPATDFCSLNEKLDQLASNLQKQISEMRKAQVDGNLFKNICNIQHLNGRIMGLEIRLHGKKMESVRVYETL